MKTQDEETLVNYSNPVVKVVHRNLQRADENSPFRSLCPFCFNGILLVGRDDKDFKLKAQDRCVLCGQAVEYIDMQDGELCLPDGGKTG